MAISSNALFHFLRKKDFFESALRDGLWPRYCIEYGWNGKGFALPMICFCDIPLTQISEHSNFYGCFGIGVSAEWIRSNKSISPVQYIGQNTHLYNRVNRTITKLRGNEADENDVTFLSRAKKVSGTVNCEGKNKIKKFYDEREWRYVPDEVFYNGAIVPIEKKTNFDVQEKSVNLNLEKLQIPIEHIRYLIIPNDSYRSRLIKFIKETYKKAAEEERLILISRILTLEQIEKDF